MTLRSGQFNELPDRVQVDLENRRQWVESNNADYTARSPTPASS